MNTSNEPVDRACMAGGVQGGHFQKSRSTGVFLLLLLLLMVEALGYFIDGRSHFKRISSPSSSSFSPCASFYFSLSFSPLCPCSEPRLLSSPHSIPFFSRKRRNPSLIPTTHALSFPFRRWSFKAFSVTSPLRPLEIHLQEDEVEKIIQWAKEVAGLDPSPPFDEEPRDDDEDEDIDLEIAQGLI
ncbi:hypothetical protein CRG98_003542 [Punica granatum]|uniref:Uncharacterized protein n=1 Tax=Punica granatum TaxID=22663 RepID=A0A2I0L623_PUNGR|nr:hypothetical protein CRG98_003542 [Punica granatum]